MSVASLNLTSLPPFRNEPYADFSRPENRDAMQAALAKVRAESGKEYPLLVAGERVGTGDTLRSLNPSRPSEVVGVHHKATPDLARKAVEEAFAFFPEWSRTPAVERVEMLFRAADILRRRKMEFNAWLTVEAGKTWPEAE